MNNKILFFCVAALAYLVPLAASGQFVMPSTVECIKESGYIISGKIIKIDSAKISIDVTGIAKGTLKTNIKISEKYWESRCLGGGYYYEYQIGDQFVFYLHKSKQDHDSYVMSQEKIENDSISLTYDTLVNDSANYIDYKISVKQYLNAISDFDEVFMPTAIKESKNGHCSHRTMHVYKHKNENAFIIYLNKSLFNKNIAECADKYIEEHSFFTENKKRRAKF
jgi:hypothetical protein